MINDSKSNNLFLTEQEKENIFNEILVYFNENSSNLIQFLTNIKNNEKIFDSTLNTLFERSKIERNEYKKLQIEIALITLIYPLFFTFNFEIFVGELVKYTGKNIDFVSEEVNNTIDWFYNTLMIDLEKFSLNSLKNLKIDDLINENENISLEKKYNLKSNNNEEDVLVIIKNDITGFCHVLIDYIKEKINVLENDFDNYINFIKEKNIYIDEIIEDLFSNNTLKNLLQNSNIEENSQFFLQAKRCTQVITLALLKCRNYYQLFKMLLELTNLSHATIWAHIKKYIPFLKIINSYVDVTKWLPSSKEIDFELLKKNVEDLSLKATGVKGDLIQPKNEEEWLIMMKNVKKPSQISINVKCNKCGDEFFSCYNYLRRDRWNCSCTKSLYESDQTYNFEKLKIEIEELGEKITGIKGTLLKPNDEETFRKMRIEQNRSPTQLEVEVLCNKCGKIWSTTVTSLIHQKNWCRRCTDSRIYTYDDIIQLVKEVTLNVIGKEGTLIQPKNEEEFKRLASKNYPSQIPLIIKCGNCGNELTYTTQYLNSGYFPCTCINLKYETILRWYFFKLFDIRFNHTKLSNLIHNYSGKLEYDGYNELIVKNGYIVLEGYKIAINNNYSISESDEQIIQNVTYSKSFEYRLEEINDFIADFEKQFFQDNDKITITLSYGKIDLIFYNNKMYLLNAQLSNKQYSLSVGNYLKIAVEFNGRQHYEFPNAFHKEISQFLDQIISDLNKRNLSNENNIFLLIFPYWINQNMDNPKIIQNFIVEQFYKKLNINLLFLPQFDHRNPEFGQFRITNF